METKKTALKRSRTGFISISIRAICRASAMTAPIRNAPSATLKPSFAASSETPKQRAITVSRSISLLLKRAT